VIKHRGDDSGRT